MGNRQAHSQNASGARALASRFGGVALIAVVVLAAVCVVVAAKYIQADTKEVAATAKEFYFESDVLDDQTHQVAATEGDEGNKTATISVTLKNHADDLRFSEVDIPFTVSVVADDGTTADGVAVSPSEGKLSNGSTQDQVVTISGLQPGKTYTVTATTNDTYTKTLSGTFAVTATNADVQASLRDGVAYIEATIWASDSSATASVTYTNGLIPDNTNSLMADWKTASGQAGSGSVFLEAYSSHTLRFFKSVSSKTYAITTTGTEVSINEQA